MRNKAVTFYNLEAEALEQQEREDMERAIKESTRELAAIREGVQSMCALIMGMRMQG